jgi:hypothetical protein
MKTGRNKVCRMERDNNDLGWLKDSEALMEAYDLSVVCFKISMSYASLGRNDTVEKLPGA